MIFLRVALWLIALQAAGPFNFSPLCEGALDPLAPARAIRQRLDHVLVGKTDVRGTTIFRMVGPGKDIAQLFYLMNGPYMMSIENISVAPQVKGQGMSKLLIAEALLHEPAVNHIEAQLAWDNASAFFSGFNALPFKTKIFKHSRANQLALERTPMYKVLHELGFTKVERIEVSGETVHIAMARELPGQQSAQ